MKNRHWALLLAMIFIPEWLLLILFQMESTLRVDILYTMLVQGLLILALAVFLHISRKLRLAKYDQWLRKDGLPPGDGEPDTRMVEERIRCFEEQIRSLSAEKNQFREGIYGIIHDLKTPITGLKLHLKQGELDAGLMLISIRDMEGTVEKLLYLSKLDRFDRDYMIERVNLDLLVKEVITSLSGQFIDKGLSLKLELVDEEVITDVKWLQFIIRQVLLNSIKYTPEGKQISIKSRETSHGMELVLRDEGVGIPKTSIKRVFDYGFTGENTRKGEATGLGLYLVKQVADRLGLDIRIESEVNRYTAVVLTLKQINLTEM